MATAAATALALPGVPQAPAARRPLETPAPGDHPFRFTGDAREYFGIWIVNLLLSILTLGIYSAWAKVRTSRYLYASTQLQGSGFDYLARPVQILKGRLIVAALFAVYIALGEASPLIGLAFVLAMPAVVPWAVVRSLRFSRGYSSYRNVRFAFEGTKGEAFTVYVLLPVAAVLTFGLLYPYAIYRRRRFQIERSRFGLTPFGFAGTPGAFYRIYGMGVAYALAAAAVALALWLVLAAVAIPVLPDGVSVYAIAPVFAFLAGVAAAHAYLSARLESYAWNQTRIGSDRFKLELEFGKVLWLYVSNALAVVCSLGLMIPWAHIRLARYKVECLSLVAPAGLDHHIAAGREAVAATGDELGEALGLDFGI